MPARINKKVVLPLIVGLTVVALGVLALSYFTLRRSPEYYKGKGDNFAAAQDWETAAEFYSKAVFRDQGNIELIDLWRATLLKIVPENSIDAREHFQVANNILQRKTEIRPFEVEFHIDWLSHVLSIARPIPSPRDCLFLSEQAELMLRAKPASDDDPLWDQANRFRGIANAYRLRETSLPQTLEEQAKADLDLALERRPDDSAAASAMLVWHINSARRLAQQNMNADCLARLQEGVDFANEYLDQHSDDVHVWLTLAELHVVENAFRVGVLEQASDTSAARRAVEQAEAISLKSTTLPWWQATQVGSELSALTEDAIDGSERALAVIDHALTLDPNQPILHYERGRYLTVLDRPDEAREVFQTLVNQPNLPVSYAGIQLIDIRPRAIVAQFDIAIERWHRTERDDTAARQAIRQRASDLIAEYRKRTTDSDVYLLYLEGRFALADGDVARAANLLNQFDTMTGTASIARNQRLIALLELATALTRSGQPGAAYPYFERALDLTGGKHVPALVAMIEIDLNGQNLDRAQSRLATLAQVAPDHPRLGTLSDRLAVSRGGAGAEVSDEIIQTILRGRDRILVGDYDGANAILVEGLAKWPTDERILLDLVRLERTRENTDEALKYVRMARSSGNDPTGQWRILEAVLTESDLKPVLERVIAEQATGSEIDRELTRWRVLKDYGFDAEAEAAFANAKKLDPDHQRVLEEEFNRALNANDFAAAQEVVSRAERANADQANGLTYRGRLELRKGDTSSAIGTLIRASEIKPYDGNVWRFLGVAYRESGNYDSAMKAFSESREREPGNVTTLREFARLQLLNRDFEGALDTIRRARNLATRDEELQTLYLQLEGQYGDRPQVITIREKMRQARPNDLENNLSLATLYTLDSRFDEARALLEGISPQTFEERLQVVQMRAELHSRESGIQSALGEFDALLNSVGEDAERVETLLAKSQFLMNQNQRDAAIEVLESARAYQDDQLRNIDRQLGGLRLEMGDYAGAIAPLESALEAEPESAPLLLRLINAHLALAIRADEAEAASHRTRSEELLDRFETNHDSTVETALFRGEIALQKSDFVSAEKVFNSAIAAYPQDPRVYTARARFNLMRIQRLNDLSRVGLLKSDVEQAVTLDPSNAEPLYVLAQFARGDADGTRRDALLHISTLRRILDIDPNDDISRQQLVEILFARGEYSQADLLINQAIEVSSNQASWQEVRGDFMRQRGAKPSEYAVAYAAAFQARPSSGRLRKLTSAWLSSEPPAASRALVLLNELKSEVDADPTLQLLRAQALHVLGRSEESRSALEATAQQIRNTTDPVMRDRWMRDWFVTVPDLVRPEELITFSEAQFPDNADPWRAALLGGALLSKGRMDEGLARLEKARTMLSEISSKDDQQESLQQDTGWLLGGAHFERKEWQKAADAWRWILESDPTHIPTLNNLAYVLAEKLDDPEAALEPARTVYEAAPTDPTLMDTYGYVLFRVGELDEAQRLLRESVDRRERAVTLMHLGEVLAAKEDFEAARRTYTQARNRAIQERNSELIAQIDDLVQKLPN